MQQRFQTPDGHIYEAGADGKYHLAQAAPFASVQTKSPDPLERALKGAELADKARKAAQAPIETRKAVAEADKAEADARIAAAKAAEASKDDDKKGKLLTDLNGDAIFRALQQAQGDIAKGHTTGAWALLRKLPYTNAQLVDSDLGTVNSQNMLAKLGELKAQSATGASGMGALSDTEGRILRESIASLDQSLPQDRLLANLKYVEEHYKRAQAIAHGLDPNKLNLNETADKTAVTALSPNTGKEVGASRNGTQTVADPTLRAIGVKVGSMLANPAVPDADILAEMKSAGVNPGDTSIAQALAYRRTPQFQAWQRKNPGKAYPLGDSFYTKDVPLSGTRSVVNSVGQTPVGAFEIGAGQAVTGNHLDEIARLTGGNAEDVRLNEQLARGEHPLAAFAGDAIGQGGLEGLGKLIPGVRVALKTTAGRRGFDAAYGAYSGSGAADDGQGGGGAALGMFTNALGGAAGRATQRGVGNVLTGARDEGLRYLNERGVPMTIGEMARAGSGVMGKSVAGLEDRLTSIPFIGDAVKGARMRGRAGMNVAAFNEGLDSISGTVEGRTGARAVDRAQDLTSQAYSNALDGVDVPHDTQFITDYGAARAAAGKIPVHGPQIVHTLDQQVLPRIATGNVTGKDLQAAIQTIRNEASKYDGLPGGTDAGDAFQRVEDSLTGLVGRARPEVMPAFNAANKAYGNKQILQAATNSAGSGQDELFTGAQLRRASINNTKNYGGANLAASTDRPFYDLGLHADNVQAPQIRDSGTAGRYIIPGALLTLSGGAGGVSGYESGKDAGSAAKGFGTGTLAGAATLGALALPYTKTGQKALQALIMGERLKAIAAAGAYVKNNPLPGSAAGRAAVDYLSDPTLSQ